MPLTEIPYKGYIVDCYFDNLLPDNEFIRERIQNRFNASSKNSIFAGMRQIKNRCTISVAQK